MRSKWLSAAVVSAAAVAALSGCQSNRRQAAALTGGDTQRGLAAIAKYGCGSCHTIAGIGAAHGLTGPPLTGVGSRLYIAGVLSNTPDNMMRWIRNPKEVDQKTAMPALGVTQQDAADIAAFLYSTK
jgi:cytochrome c2